MTLLTTALDRIARQCSVKTPSSWLAATRDEHLEIRDDFLLEAVDDILDRVDLGEPIAKKQTLSGAGTDNGDDSGNFTLNANFKRLQRDEWSVYDPLQDRIGIPVSQSGEWSYLTDIGTSGIYKHYRLKGYEGNYSLDVYRNLSAGDTLEIHYISDVWLTNGGTEKNAFTDADDTLLLPRRLVESGTVWRYRERRGLPYQDKYAEYEALMSRAILDSRNLRTIRFGEPDMSVKWQDLVPAFIPSS